LTSPEKFVQMVEGKETSPDSDSSSKRPALRRERTFDLDPACCSGKDAVSRLVDISLDASPARNAPPPRAAGLSAGQERQLADFRRRRKECAEVARKELARLADIERKLAEKAVACGPEPLRCWGERDDGRDEASATSIESPVVPIIMSKSALADPPRQRPVPLPRTRIPMLLQSPARPPGQARLPPPRPARKRDGLPKDTAVQNESFLGMSQSCYAGLSGADVIVAGRRGGQPKPKGALVTLADVKRKNSGHLRLQSKADTASSRQGSSLSWFIPNDGEEEKEQHEEFCTLLDRYKAKKREDEREARRAKAFFVECDDGDDDDRREKRTLQESLELRRPDYIAKTMSRQTDRLAKRAVQADRATIVENVPVVRQGRARMEARSSAAGQLKVSEEKAKKKSQNEARKAKKFASPYSQKLASKKPTAIPRRVDVNTSTEVQKKKDRSYKTNRTMASLAAARSSASVAR